MRQLACKNGHEFNVTNTYTGPDGKRTCKVCRRARQTGYRNADKTKARRQWTKDALYKKYGLTPEQVEMMKIECQICKTTEDLCIDHNHKTGLVRGVLCGKCNRGLGNFNDDTELLYGAVNYLKAV